MKTILNTIVDLKRHEVAKAKSKIRYSDFEQFDNFNRTCLSLKTELLKSNFGIIAELKRKSPSAGIINADLNIQKQGEYYEKSNVAGISCLTDSNFFGGSLDDLTLLRTSVNVPILRKEFIIDEFQIFEAKAYGADVILLISEILSAEEILHFTIIAQSLGMEVIVESNNKTNLEKMNDHVDIIGINNRDLHIQKTDIQTSRDLYKFIPNNAICISESGIKSKDELFELDKIGFNGALIGESILKSSDANFLSQLTNIKSAVCL